jgi:hypothetical protein
MHRTFHLVAPSLPGTFVTMRLAQLGLPGVSAIDLTMPQVVPDTLPARLTDMNGNILGLEQLP